MEEVKQEDCGRLRDYAPGGITKSGGPKPQQEGQDNWAVRGKTMVCRTCMYWVRKRRSDAVTTTGFLGRCRRHAPTLGGWPAVYETDWCGDHKLDEDKMA